MLGGPISLEIKSFIRRVCISICVGIALWLMAVYKNLERENNVLLKSLERYTKVRINKNISDLCLSIPTIFVAIIPAATQYFHAVQGCSSLATSAPMLEH